MNYFSRDEEDVEGVMRKAGPMAGLRWAFKFSTWNPSQEEWTLAATAVQREEKDRIGRFVFKKDAKSAMVS